MPEPGPSSADQPGLDFDGAYGRTYRRSIRGSVPGYESLIEIAAAGLQQAVPQARSVLVVGPGLGEELVPALAALPEARFTLLEPSSQMREVCAGQIAAVGATQRCTLLEFALEPGTAPPGAPFEAVVCHNVLHLLAPEGQRELLQTLADLVAPGGALLLSSYSEVPAGAAFDALLAIAATRLRQLGLSEALIAQVMASRNALVFSLAQDRLETALAAAGLEPPLLLQQALFSRLWLSRRPG